MEKVLKKHPLKEEKVAPLISDQEEAMHVFAELLKRGRAFYPNHGTAERYPRVCRVTPLRES